MGVRARIVLFAPSQELADSAASRTFARLSELDAMMSDYRPASELNQLCQAAIGVPHRVSPDLFGVLETGQRLAAATGGGFDVTLGPATALWRQSRKSGQLAAESERSAALARTGWRKLTLDREQQTATLSVPGMQLDLGGIAKGFAAQEGVRRLNELGYSRVLVAMAGDIATGDAPPGEAGWKVASTADAEGRALLLCNQSISTSGDTEQFVEIEGRRYSHLIDPATGLGSAGGVLATVVSADGALADALAKPLCMSACDDDARRIIAGLSPGFAPVAAIIRRRDRTEPTIIDPAGLLRRVQETGQGQAEKKAVMKSERSSELRTPSAL